MKIFKRFWNYLRWYFYWRYEQKRCLADTHYFMVKYWRVFDREDKLQKMNISKEQFDYLNKVITKGPWIMSKSNIQKYNEHRSE